MKEVEFERIVGHKLELPEEEELEQGKLKVKKVHYPKLTVKHLL